MAPINKHCWLIILASTKSSRQCRTLGSRESREMRAVHAARPFRFKQFTVHQEISGLKVSIDAVLFGALVNRYSVKSRKELSCCDVGTGSGLLALMMSQEMAQNEAKRGGSSCGKTRIVAVDIDEHAVQEARRNVSASPWDVDVVESSWQDYAASQEEGSFNLIVSNPPFFPRPPVHSHKKQRKNRAKQLGLVRPVQGDDSSEPHRFQEEIWPKSRAHARTPTRHLVNPATP